MNKPEERRDTRGGDSPIPSYTPPPGDMPVPVKRQGPIPVPGDGPVPVSGGEPIAVPTGPGSAGESEPIPVPMGTSGAGGSAKIQTFAQSLAVGRHEDKWSRSPNVTGTGAIHVKSFHCKLNVGSLEMLDQQINEWLDEHPQYEVKFVTTSIGEWSGKTKEPNLIVQVWV